MNAEMRTKIREVIIKQIEYKQFIHAASDSNLKIGFNHDITQRGISLPIALELLNEDIHYYISKITHYFNRFAKLNDDQQIALVSLCHFIGWQNVISDQDLMSALDRNDYDHAARIMFMHGYDTLAYMMTLPNAGDIMNNNNVVSIKPKD